MPIRPITGIATTDIEPATVDTSIWVDSLKGVLPPDALSAFPTRERSIVPTLVQFELAKWLEREADAATTEAVIAYTQKCVVVPLHASLALRAATISRRHKLATADAIIYAVALHTNTPLLTCDKHFEGLPNVRYFPKRID